MLITNTLKEMALELEKALAPASEPRDSGKQQQERIV